MKNYSQYHNSIKNNFNFLKETDCIVDLFTKAIILPENMGHLLPICHLHVDDENLIKTLAIWRDKNKLAFPTQFTVTLDGTKKWLKKNVLEVEDRLLFLIIDKFANPVGHIGLANGFNEFCHIEIDNVVRGETQIPGIMSVALKKLIDWTYEFIAPDKITLRVFDDNLHAIKFYESLGFLTKQSIALKKEINNDYISYQPLLQQESTADKYFLEMHYCEKTFKPDQLISTAGPSISAREISYANDAARNGWNNKFNYYIKLFEQTFAEYLGIKHALSTSSCTGALHIALQALDIGPGDEVIVPDLTWVATANAVRYVGATPIFADVNPLSWCMDPNSFKSLITPKTKAVIPVHLYGHPAEIDTIVTIARNHNLYIIEDAAPAIGAKFKSQKVGTFGDFAAFSFQGAKLAVTGEGGMLVTNNDRLFEKALTIWDQGREPGTFWIKQNGLKYKMSNIQAALGLGQIQRINELIAAKRRIFAWYHEFLQDIDYIRLNYETDNAYSIYWMTSILLNEKAPVSRDQLCIKLKKDSIDTRPVFPAISQYPHWPNKQQPQANAFLIGKNAINLPSGGCLRKNQIEYICKSLIKALNIKQKVVCDTL